MHPAIQAAVGAEHVRDMLAQASRDAQAQRARRARRGWRSRRRAPAAGTLATGTLAGAIPRPRDPGDVTGCADCPPASAHPAA